METTREVRLFFVEDQITETLRVRPVGPNLYRLEESALLGEVNYHDVVEAVSQADGTLQVVRVVTPSGFKISSWILSPDDWLRIEALLEKVIATGGCWERACEGILTIHLPLDVADELRGEFHAALTADS